MVSTLLSDSAGGDKLDALHINVLLTPVRGLAFLVKKDARLLRKHKANILRALRQVKAEIKAEPTSHGHGDYTVADIDRLLARLTVSNSGVNEGAVGTTMKVAVAGKKRSFTFRGGWEESIGKYNNEGAKRLNNTMASRLESLLRATELPTGRDLAVFRNLGAAAHVAMDLNEMWANNDFARADVGSNQFKFPAAWGVLDNLMGIKSYTGCMSAKDRTLWVKSDEKSKMQIIQAKEQLQLEKLDVFLKTAIKDDRLTRAEYEADKSILTSPSFRIDDLEAVLVSKAAGASVTQAILDQVKVVTMNAQEALNLVPNEDGSVHGIMERKDVSRSVNDLDISKLGTSASLRSLDGAAFKAMQLFPRTSPVSIYTYQDDALIAQFETGNPTITADKLAQLQEQHFERQSFRSCIGTSLQVTGQNTGALGSKLHFSDSIGQLASGFNRAYVMYQCLNSDAADPTDLFKSLTSLNELVKGDATTAETSLYFQHKFQEAMQVANPGEKSTALLNVLKELEEAKFQTTRVHAKVSS
ncbi:hypothetical protein DID80_07875 [Candidatus Marinamargulisbacteria bacterium SCGC AAA071-K20]|nr:hypothetical protein DID80_07875 [Candidatus Marinamargulisbacteria bacterium SCGC AAA071-K20]